MNKVDVDEISFRNMQKTINAMKDLLLESVRRWKFHRFSIDCSSSFRISRHFPSPIRSWKKTPRIFSWSSWTMSRWKRWTFGKNNRSDLWRFWTISSLFRGNLMGETGARVLTNVVQTNRHLQTIFFDRNLLLLNHFEDLVNALEE